MKNRFVLKSIRTKLLAILILICILPVILLGFVSYHESYKILNAKLSTTTNQTLKEINTGIDNYFSVMISDATLLSNNYDIENLSTHPEFETYANSILQEVKDSNNNILDVYFSDVNKHTLIYPSEQIPSDYDPTQRSWYKDALANSKKAAFSNVYKDAVTNKNVLTISKTVYNNGQFVGVIGIDIDLSSLSNKLSASKIGNSGYVFLTSKDGTIISNKDKSLIGSKKITTSKLWQEIKTKNSGFFEYNDNGNNMFSSYLTNSSTGWKVIGLLNQSELSRDTNSIMYITLICILITIILAFIISFLFSNTIVKVINNLMSSFEKAAAGDLSVITNIKTGDEFETLGNHFNDMIENIHGLIKSIKISSDDVLTTSTQINDMSKETTNAISEIATTVDHLAQGASSQTQNIMSSANELDSLASKIENIDSATSNINNISKDTGTLTKQGFEIMKKLTTKTDSANKSSREVAEVVQAMTHSSNEIGLITETINNIAKQTNLLALNAAIEAARAGEAGKGFSVVADEIRKLAEQSTTSTNQINSLIEDIKSKTANANKSITTSMDIVKEQTLAVHQTQDIFNEISESIEILMTHISSIEKHIIDTNKSKNEIVERIQNISAVSEESSASTEEVSATTEEITASMIEFDNSANKLKEIVENLECKVNTFKL
ncbi:methyl-accepting chemotaxis sensory transducer with Cache sensor [Clostridium acidisoli DSM 12555]|uniref:Methyl-accepting chemotaxis sensory transducer with Cache sensor n=1 Tax=Clostridium acidisoli DSM 12555 TaxID=1121291 RepID=A0A1W1X765_9CLOT|nr:methyl-accepting chemotaxis protein [Clostridium acidisoli]SMC19588.1 methyl-accepting chemotaxis sensory transducer with Cache sensor [Clostridium acidisoli DSM 12555]